MNKKTSEKKQAARVLRASIDERIELLQSRPERNRATAKEYRKLAKQYNKLLFKY